MHLFTRELLQGRQACAQGSMPHERCRPARGQKLLEQLKQLRWRQRRFRVLAKEGVSDAEVAVVFVQGTGKYP